MDELPKELIVEIIQWLPTGEDITNFLIAYKSTSIVIHNLSSDNITFQLLVKNRYPLIFEDIRAITNDIKSDVINYWLNIYSVLIEQYKNTNSYEASFEEIFKDEGFYGYFCPTVSGILYRAVFNKYFIDTYDMIKYKHDFDIIRMFHRFLIDIDQDWVIRLLDAPRSESDILLFKFLYSNNAPPSIDYTFDYLIPMISNSYDDLLLWTLEHGERSYIDNDEFENELRKLENILGVDYVRKYRSILLKYEKI